MPAYLIIVFEQDAGGNLFPSWIHADNDADAARSYWHENSYNSDGSPWVTSYAQVLTQTDDQPDEWVPVAEDWYHQAGT